MTSKYKLLREEAWSANRALHAQGLASLTFGNVSVADRRASVFSIKPSGIGYEQLTPDDMVVVDFDGAVVAGDLRPSSDTPTHRLLLNQFEKMNSVVHTHSPKAVAFAQAGRPLECLGTTHADYFHGSVPVTRALTPPEIESDYEANTGRVILETFAGQNPQDLPAVLVRGHGPFVWGPSWVKAIENAAALELCAAVALDVLLLNSQTSPLCVHLRSKHHSRKHGPTAYYGQG